ncbi:MAG: DUF4393 domain-containing protein [Eubacterium sp.]|nr:DUF4393 domain-containing protein [Eubacterium sp.]
MENNKQIIQEALKLIEKWFGEEQYDFENTTKALADKMNHILPNMIVSPEPHIAVPAAKYASYCAGDEKLHHLCINLLASSMNKMTRKEVHPGFVEVIKQLCGDEVEFLKYMAKSHSIPTLNIVYENKDRLEATILKDFSLVPQLAGCKEKYESEFYIDNLVRLGLVARSDNNKKSLDDQEYLPLIQDEFVQRRLSKDMIESYGFTSYRLEEGFIDLTAYGKRFCALCIDIF